MEYAAAWSATGGLAEPFSWKQRRALDGKRWGRQFEKLAAAVSAESLSSAQICSKKGGKGRDGS